jgi:hypothetical protein
MCDNLFSLEVKMSVGWLLREHLIIIRLLETYLMVIDFYFKKRFRSRTYQIGR